MLLHFTKVPQQSRSARENASTPLERKKLWKEGTCFFLVVEGLSSLNMKEFKSSGYLGMRFQVFCSFSYWKTSQPLRLGGCKDELLHVLVVIKLLCTSLTVNEQGKKDFSLILQARVKSSEQFQQC